MTLESSQDGAVTETTEGEGTQETETSSQDVVTLSKDEFAKLNATIGSLKRDIKDFRKAQTDTPEKTTSKDQKTEEFGLLQKSYLRAAGISKPEEVDLAIQTAKKWDMDIDKLVDDEDFQSKLDKLRIKTSNELATSNIRSGQGQSQAKNTPDYWIAKGEPPTRDQVPDRSTRVKIARAMMANAKGSGKKFYNE